MANANPFISIGAALAGIVKLGKSGNLLVQVGNAGNDTIAAQSLEVTISMGNNVRVTSLSKVKNSQYKAWKVKSISKELVGNTIKLINTRKFEMFDLSQIILNVKGVKLGGPSTVTAFVGYIIGINPNTGSQSISQGNASPTDDNSTSSFTVVK